MTGQILINYDEVYSKTAEMRQRLESELMEMDTRYRQVQSILRGLDGKTNAVFIEAMRDNQRKARVTAETLRELIMFMDSSARLVERQEEIHKRAFTAFIARR